jgi:methionyl-tRNA synthetase
LRLPDTIYTHSFINLEGKKISKSLGNVIRPTELVSQFGADAVRYFFLRYGPAAEDVDVSVKKIKDVYNSELANDWGNLISRVAKLAERNNVETHYNASLQITKTTVNYLQNLQIPQALNDISKKITQTNQFINEKEPWRKKGKELEKILTYVVSQIIQIVFDLAPFMPESSAKILKQFSTPRIKSEKPYFKRFRFKKTLLNMRPLIK